MNIATTRPDFDLVRVLLFTRCPKCAIHTHHLPIIMDFLKLKGVFDSVNRTALLDVLQQKAVPQKFVNLLWSLYSHISGRLKRYAANWCVYSSGKVVLDKVALLHHCYLTLSSTRYRNTFQRIFWVKALNWLRPKLCRRIYVCVWIGATCATWTRQSGKCCGSV